MLVESLATLQKDFLETSRSNRKYKSTCIHEHLRTTSKIIIINWRAYYSAVSHGLSVFINKTKIVQKHWWRSVNFTLILQLFQRLGSCREPQSKICAAQIRVDFLLFWKARASWKWQRLQIRLNMVSYSSGIFMWQALARGNDMSIYSITELMSFYSINELSLWTTSRPTIVQLEDF